MLLYVNNQYNSMGNIDFSAGYVCGTLCSDGTIAWNEKFGNYAIVLEVKDGGFAEAFLHHLNSCVSKEAKLRIQTKLYKQKPYWTHVVYLYGKAVVGEFVRKWGLKAGTHNWEVPKHAYENESFRRGFLRAFFDGEGSIRIRIKKRANGKSDKRRIIRATSVNKEGLSSVRKLLEIEGMKSMLYPVGNAYCIDMEGKTKMEIFERNIGSNHSEKRRKIKDALRPLSLEDREVPREVNGTP